MWWERFPVFSVAIKVSGLSLTPKCSLACKAVTEQSGCSVESLMVYAITNDIYLINCDLTPAYVRATPSCPRSHHLTPSSHISTHAQPPSFSPGGGGGPDAAAPAPAATGLAVVSPGVDFVRPTCMQLSVSARGRAWACVACARVCSVRVASRARGCVARSRMDRADLSAPNDWPGV